MRTANRPHQKAVLAELGSLGMSQTRVSKLLGKQQSHVSQLCKRVGVRLPRESAGWEPHKAKSRARAKPMAQLYRAGFTLAQIGEMHGISRERVRQIMTKHFGIRAEDGGRHKRHEETVARRQQRRDAWALREKGCTYEQYTTLRDMLKPTRAYAAQRRNAHKRGVGWELNLWQWWTIWQESGHWQERGRTRESYVMCRHRDSGPYAVGNVFIATASTNAREIYHNRRLKAAEQMVAA